MRHSSRLILLSLAILLVCGTAAILASDETVIELLRTSIAGERAAQARYVKFAVKADEEGLGGVASLFRACARAEKAHEERLLSLLKKRGGTAPEGIEEPVVGTTRENLQAAMSAEQAERDTSYHDAFETAKAAGDAEVAKVLDQCRTGEAEHANLLMAANWSLGSMSEPRAYYVCSGCGFTSEMNLPRGCPMCPGKKLTAVK